ncbi:hypothetical protein G6F65_015320 [Rhizopus arrhizus]|nr:hypothetical protein G6F65_015320 [Rhizopus arrhizus]
MGAALPSQAVALSTRATRSVPVCTRTSCTVTARSAAWAPPARARAVRTVLSRAVRIMAVAPEVGGVLWSGASLRGAWGWFQGQWSSIRRARSHFLRWTHCRRQARPSASGHAQPAPPPVASAQPCRSGDRAGGRPVIRGAARRGRPQPAVACWVPVAVRAARLGVDAVACARGRCRVAGAAGGRLGRVAAAHRHRPRAAGGAGRAVGRALAAALRAGCRAAGQPGDAFAALTAHYARSTALARDDLARVNADLLATRALLADSARDAERLRLARELHDVAGHKLTAMRLNLRALAADPALAGRDGLVLAEQLSGELLADIRQVVQSMRDDRGLDLATALHALAAPFPRPKLQLRIGEGVRVTDPLMAETVLRLVQEALTNAARHGNAGTVWLTINEEDSRLRIDIHDDGQRAERIREGNGIAGMRERLDTVHGRLELARTAQGGMLLTAWVPA